VRFKPLFPDAFEGYGHEPRFERVSYVKPMAKKGYRIPRVYVGG
jgi:hypothetical protein